MPIRLRFTLVLRAFVPHLIGGAVHSLPPAPQTLLHALHADVRVRSAVTLWVFPTVRSPLERITEEDEYGYRDARFAVPTPGR